MIWRLLAIALTVILPAAVPTADAGASSVRTVTVSGRSYANLYDVAMRYSMRFARTKTARVLSGRSDRLTVYQEKRYMFLNGVRISQCFSPIVRAGTVYVSSLDLSRTIDPLLGSRKGFRHSIRTIMLDIGHGGKDPFPPQQMHASERTIRPIHTDGHEKLVRPVRSDEQEMRQSHAGASGTAEQTAAPADGQAGEAAASVTDGLPLSDADYGARKVPELGRATFYESVSDQLQKLFDKCERYTALEKLLPDSRWVKVDYDTSGRYYLVGLIGDPVRYMCYGVPGEYSPEPPPELAGYCQWLAVDPNDPAGKGFWIMYQDGVTGKSIL